MVLKRGDKMAGNFGGVIKLTGEDEYKKALQQIRQSLSETGSSLTAITSSFDNSDKSMEATKNAVNRLNSVLDQQKTSYNNLKTSYDDMLKIYEKNKEKIVQLQAARDNEKEKLEKIGQSLGKNSKEYKDQQKVVDDLTETIDNATNRQNQNEISLSKMRTQLNQSETAINKTTKAIDDLGEETEDSSKKANEAGNGGFTVFKGILANLGTQVITSVLNGLKSLGSGLFNLGKQAVENFTEFEQLEGGVKKLFGDDFQTVIDNANNGFASAGMSANDYMDTVTSFSASLISGLNGDTAKAAQIADIAIKDMSDNANTFGTDMESIQNAYQGFAKGNFTMLDNLKLGYGGTQEEMARLINESGVLGDSMNVTAETVKDVPFDQMILAINKTQERMGIMGTTSKEASTTIEGSTNAMKASWQNLLTGMASGGDLTPLINNFVDSVMTLGHNLIPVIQNVIQGMGQLASGLLTELVPKLVEEIPPLITNTLPILIDAINTAINAIVDVLPSIIDAISDLIPQILSALLSLLPKLIEVGIKGILSLVNGLNQAMPDLIGMLPEIIVNIVNTLIENLPAIIETGINLLTGIIEGLTKAIPQLIDMLPSIITTIIETLINNLPMLVNCAIQLMVALTNGLIQSLPKLATMVPTIIITIVNTLIQNLPKILTMGVKILTSIIEGIGQNFGNLANKAKEIGTTIIDKVKEFPGKMIEAGKDLVKGIWDGITGNLNWIKDKISEWVGNVTNFIMKLFGINSPSKLFRDKIGKPLAEGIGVGFSDEMKNVTNEMQNAIPTKWDVEGNLNTAKNNKENVFKDFSYTQTVNAFKEALAGMTVEMDDENMGRFVRKTVEKAIYA